MGESEIAGLFSECEDQMNLMRPTEKGPDALDERENATETLLFEAMWFMKLITTNPSTRTKSCIPTTVKFIGLI